MVSGSSSDMLNSSNSSTTMALASFNSEVFTWSRGLWQGIVGSCGHSWAISTQRSGATVEGGPGLLDSVLDNVDAGVDCQHVLSVLLRLVSLLKLALLGKHLVKFVLDPSFLLHLTSLHRVHN
jgi:hypothetical protein